jgi:hypothetical protein
MADSESANDERVAADADQPALGQTSALGTGRRPRPTGDEAAMPQVQLVLGLFIVFLFLLVLWMVWPVLSH